mgnify:FL=1
MTLRYTITPVPNSGTFLIELALSARDELLLRLPAWLPGSYMIRDMAAEIQSLAILCGGQSLDGRKVDKSTWRVQLGEKERKVTVRYEVFAQDSSVRRAYLDSDRGFLTFSSLCLCPIGREEEAIEIEIREPKVANGWKVATELSPLQIKENGFGRYQAENYDELIDSPMEIGPWQAIEFKAYGVYHRIILSGKVPPFDQQRLKSDVKCCAETVISFFEPKTHKAPFASYSFFLNLSENLYGGLEHRASTALAASFFDLPIVGDKTISAGYAKLLELFTHEYFHAWWVKRVKPSVFIPYDLTQETYTNLLWVFEGFTSYYDALLTARSGATDTESYLKSLSETLNRHYLGSAKNRQSLAESSFDAWIKYYKVRTNRSRSVTSYYDKGALVAMALDAFIQKESAGKHSLDDVLRYAWQQFKEVGKDYAGIDEEMMPELIFEATGIDVSEKIDRWVYGCEEPDYKRVLKTMGIDLTEEKLPVEREVLQATLSGTNALKVSQLDEAGAAELAGLCVGDELLAIDSIRVTKSNLEKLLNRYRQAKTFSLHVFRNGLLKEFFLKPRKADVRKIKLSVGSSGKIFCRWLNH